MAYTPEEFLQLDLKERHIVTERCVACEQPFISKQPLDRRQTPSGSYHEDCFFDALGGAVEQHPIGRIPGSASRLRTP